MRQEWFEDPNNVVFIDSEEFLDHFGSETGIPRLRQEVENFWLRPRREGMSVRGTRRTTLKLVIPDLYFGTAIDRGDNVWIYMGEQYPAYCLMMSPEWP